HAPQRSGWLLFLTIWGPLTIPASYPAAFVAGGMSIAMLPKMWQAGSRARALYVVYNALIAVAFLVHYFGVTRNQIDAPQLDDNREFMQDYWHDSFPPASAAALPLWLLKAHAGGLFA